MGIEFPLTILCTFYQAHDHVKMNWSESFIEFYSRSAVIVIFLFLCFLQQTGTYPKEWAKGTENCLNFSSDSKTDPWKFQTALSFKNFQETQ